MKIVFLKLILKFFPNILDSYKDNLLRKIYRKIQKIFNFIKYGTTDIFTGISIETSTFCNRRCTYCPNHNNPTPKLYTDEKIIYKFIDDLSKIKYSGWIGWNFYNEPVLDERLMKFSKLAKEKIKKATNILLTNGDFLTLENTIQYKNNGIDVFIITIHDKNTEKLYQKLSPIREKIGNNFIIKTLEKDELTTRAGNVEIDRENLSFKYCDVITNPVIDKDGKMLICCNDYFRETAVGNIMNNTILEIWNNKDYKKLRKKLNYDLINSVNNKTIPDTCIKCYYSMNNINI